MRYFCENAFRKHSDLLSFVWDNNPVSVLKSKREPGFLQRGLFYAQKKDILSIELKSHAP